MRRERRFIFLLLYIIITLSIYYLSEDKEAEVVEKKFDEVIVELEKLDP